MFILAVRVLRNWKDVKALVISLGCFSVRKSLIKVGKRCCNCGLFMLGTDVDH